MNFLIGLSLILSPLLWAQTNSSHETKETIQEQEKRSILQHRRTKARENFRENMRAQKLLRQNQDEKKENSRSEETKGE